MVHYRRFRNTDPPRLAAVWNDCFTGRGAVGLRGSMPLEQYVFAKPYFDPAGLILAEDEGQCVGFAHAGFAVNEQGTDLDTSTGVTCLIGVRRAYQRRGIGSELLRRCESYLHQRGARTLLAGPQGRHAPFYVGLYGGSQAPGFLASDPSAASFFARNHYLACQKTLVLQRRCREPPPRVEPSLARYAPTYQMHLRSPKGLRSWWLTCQFNLLEPVEFFLADKCTHEEVAWALVWEMDGFNVAWNLPAVGVIDLVVRQPLRRQGLGQFFLGLLLRHVQEQFFEVVEIQVNENNVAALGLCRRLEFEEVDTGFVYKKAANDQWSGVHEMVC